MSNKQSQQNPLLLLIVGAAIGWAIWGRSPNVSPVRPVPPNNVVVNPVNPDRTVEPDIVDTLPESQLEGSYLVVVEESKSRPAERIKVLNDYEFWFGLKARGMAGFRIYDPDSNDASSFIKAAEKRSIKHPFVVHAAGNGKVMSVIEFPTDGTAKIEALLQ